MKQIQGRFNTRLSLSSASVDEVIKERILAKTDEAATLLRLVYNQNASGMRNLFTFDKNNIIFFAKIPKFIIPLFLL